MEFPRAALNAPVERRLNKKKSWLAAGVAAVGVVMTRLLFAGFAGEQPRGCEVDCLPS